LKDSFRENNDKTRIYPKQKGVDRYSLDFQTAASKDYQPVEVGTVLNNRFVLEEFIASGGMGVVFKAKDLLKVEAMDRNPFIAIKVLNEDFKEHPESWIALQREARKSQHLSHPNIITVFDFTVDRDKAIYFMTMELLEGESLKALIGRVSKDGLCLNCEKVVEILEGMANALSYAHKKGIVHSDLKPSNVFITHDGTVKVLDFGIARAVKKIDQSEDETIFDPAKLGALTPAYASCEMIEGVSPDPRDDIYALACIVYELLTGKHPFNRRTALEAAANSLKPKCIERLSKEQWKGLCKGLELRRQNRTLTAAAFLMQFRKPKRAGWSVSKILLIIGLILLIPICFYGYLFYESHSLENQIAKVESLLDAEELSYSQVGEAKQKLKELIASNPDDTRLSAMSDNVAIAYLNLAKEAESRHSLDAAIKFLREGLKETENEEIIDTLNSSLGKLENRRKIIASLEQSFRRGLEESPITANSLSFVWSVLDQLSQIDPSHPVLTSGRQRIEQEVIATARRKVQKGAWQQALQLIQDSKVKLPESMALLDVYKELQEGYQVQLKREKEAKYKRLSKIRARKAQVEQSSDSGLSTDIKKNTEPVPKIKWVILPKGAEKID